MQLSGILIASIWSITSLIWASSASAAHQPTSQSVISVDDPVKVPGESPLEFCPGDHGGDLVTIDFVDLSPNPPRAGQDVQITACGVVLKTINVGAYVNITVKYGLIRILTTKMDLCEQIKNVDLTCPVKPGPVEITKNVTLPGQIPPGKYNVHAEVYNADDVGITCLQATTVFSRYSVPSFTLEL